jgi:hypothetical protein
MYLDVEIFDGDVQRWVGEPFRNSHMLRVQHHCIKAHEEIKKIKYSDVEFGAGCNCWYRVPHVFSHQTVLVNERPMLSVFYHCSTVLRAQVRCTGVWLEKFFPKDVLSFMPTFFWTTLLQRRGQNNSFDKQTLGPFWYLGFIDTCLFVVTLTIQ